MINNVRAFAILQTSGIDYQKGMKKNLQKWVRIIFDKSNV